MAEIRLGEVESRFADIIWQNEPLSSGELARLAETELGWKESTSYTILKRLCQRGLFQNVKRTVTSLISKEEFYAMQSEKFVEDTFEGSLPAFLAAFSKRKKYTDEEVEKMKQILDSMRG
ncbi:MAG: BlaI/MecI/CopY family transcriptional regulator [Clostridia bacterium]|nr:BlaI/MecI/CopY family transcriptional regulator [Clostridia bacterium]